MDYFQIKNFRPVETKESATDQDRTVLRLCEGVVPVPQGALSTGPRWYTMWRLNDLANKATAALAKWGANPAKAHFLQITHPSSSRVLLVVWSLQAKQALGLFEVSKDETDNAELENNAFVVAVPESPWQDKNASAPWFASRIGDRWLFGNGIDANLVWHDGILSVFGPSAPPTDSDNRFRVRIPPCTCFRQNTAGNIFAAGNRTQPLRVWITDTPVHEFPFPDGIQSLERSFIDIHPHRGATKITALSTWMNYITAHTDAAPVNIYGVDNTEDGWKCEQAASAANASAISPTCVGDADGDASFYLGRDGEVYKDESVRSGPWEKRVARDQDIATPQGANMWNRDMARPLTSEKGWHCIYDRVARLFWIFAQSRFGGRVMLWLFNERTRTCAGPIFYPDAAVSTTLAGPDSRVAIITAGGQLLFTKLSDVAETEPMDMEPPGTPLGEDFKPKAEAECSPGLSTVGLSADRQNWIERIGATDGGAQIVSIGLSDPFGAMEVVANPVADDMEWFRNASIARWESPWQDLGDAARFKNWLEVELTFDRHARAYVGVAVENERGHRRWRWTGCTHGRSKPIRVPINLLGVRMRVRVLAVVFNDARAMLRDMRIGYNAAGAD